jgi:hypothetical protein
VCKQFSAERRESRDDNWILVNSLATETGSPGEWNAISWTVDGNEFSRKDALDFKPVRRNDRREREKPVPIDGKDIVCDVQFAIVSHYSYGFPEKVRYENQFLKYA